MYKNNVKNSGAYAACGGRGVYLGITTLCSFTSACYVLVKSIVMLGVASGEWGRRHRDFGEKGGAAAVEALFLSSLALAVAHLVVAYRTSCRERRKLLVYRIDIEAVSIYISKFSLYLEFLNLICKLSDFLEFSSSTSMFVIL